MNEHYFSNPERATPEEQQHLNTNLRGHEVLMWVSDRVFSSHRLDKGTEQLLHAVPTLPNHGNILDLGCGWGAIAIAAALECPEASVWAVDVNERALALCEQNARTNRVSNIIALQGDKALEMVREENVNFQTILSNLPVRIGKNKMHELVETWLQFLAEDGDAWFVMNKNLGADSFMKWLSSTGFSVKKFASRKGFRIINVRH